MRRIHSEGRAGTKPEFTNERDTRPSPHSLSPHQRHTTDASRERPSFGCTYLRHVVVVRRRSPRGGIPKLNTA